MNGRTIERRQVFRGVAGVAAGGLLATGVGVSSAAADDKDRRGLLGSWRVTHQNDPPAAPETAVAVVSFASGGVIVSHDINPAGPPFTGTWAHQGDGRFKGTLWTGFPGTAGPGSPGGTARLQVKGRLRNDMISGTFVFTLFDPTGEEVDSGTGTFSGTPIDA